MLLRCFSTTWFNSGEFTLFWRTLQNVAKYPFLVLFFWAKIFFRAIFYAFPSLGSMGWSTEQRNRVQVICIWWGLEVRQQLRVMCIIDSSQSSCPSRLTSDAQSDAPVSLGYPTRLVSSPKLLGQIFNESEGYHFHRAISTLELYWSFLCWQVWVILSSDAMEFLFLFEIVTTQTDWFV